jgi:hypothetical protein
MPTITRAATAQPEPEPRRFVVRTYYGDTLTDEATVTGARGPHSAARRHLTATGDALLMSDRRDDHLTPSATRWTLTERGTGFPAGSVTVAELSELVPTCSNCPSRARNTDACPNYGIDRTGAWLCVNCCTTCCAEKAH